MTAGIGDHWGAHRQTLEGHGGWVTAVFSPDDSTLASASNDRTVRLWDMATGTRRKRCPSLERWYRADCCRLRRSVLARTQHSRSDLVGFASRAEPQGAGCEGI
jgi:WD40 repeat protein